MSLSVRAAPPYTLLRAWRVVSNAWPCEDTYGCPTHRHSLEIGVSGTCRRHGTMTEVTCAAEPRGGSALIWGASRPAPWRRGYFGLMRSSSARNCRLWDHSFVRRREAVTVLCEWTSSSTRSKERIALSLSWKSRQEGALERFEIGSALDITRFLLDRRTAVQYGPPKIIWLRGRHQTSSGRRRDV